MRVRNDDLVVPFTSAVFVQLIQLADSFDDVVISPAAALSNVVPSAPLWVSILKPVSMQPCSTLVRLGVVQTKDESPRAVGRPVLLDELAGLRPWGIHP